MKKLFLILLIIFVTLISNFQVVYAQDQHVVDSLLNCLEKATEDTIKINLLNDIGHVYRRGNLEKAESFAMKALHLAKNIDYRNGIGRCYTILGLINSDKSFYTKSIEYYLKSLKINEELGSKKGVSSCFNNIGLVHYYQGNYNKAIEYYLKSLKIKEELGDKKGISSSFNNIGLVHYYQGNYNKAIGYYLKSLKINEKLGNKKEISNYFNNVGIIYHAQGDYNKAHEYFVKAANLMEEVGDKIRFSNCLNNIGYIHNIMGNYDKSIEYIEKSMKIKMEIGDNIGISICLNSMGEIYLKQKKYNIALDHFKEALKLSCEIETQSGIVESNNFLGKLYLKKGDYMESLHCYQNALIENLPDYNDSSIRNNPRKLNTLSKPFLLETLNQKAKAFYLLYKKENTIKDIETSIATYELVFKLVYAMRNDYSHESTQLLLSENTKNYFADAIEAAIAYNIAEPGHENEVKAFEYMEKSKSATLGAYLNDSKMKQNWHIADTLLDKEKDIAIYRRFYETAIQKAKAKKEGYDTLLVQDYQDKLFDYSLQYDSLITTLKNEYPNYYKLKYEQNVASIKSAQHQLDNNSALINYFVGDSTLFISVITNNLFAYKVVKTDSLFSQKIIDYHIDIKSGFTQKELDASAYLYQYLISPIEEYIKNKNKLVIIPDGDLYYLPFETLCKNASYSDDLSKIDYLVKNYSVSYHHSATLWLNSLEKTKTQVASSENFIGFAPVFDSKTNNGYILSREWMPDTTSTEIATRSVSIDFNHFNALPYSEEEIKSIVKLFSKKGKNAEGYFYRDASEESFKQNTRNYSYIHIASHSFANDYYPSLSGIAFSQPDTSIVNENGDDGILYAGETYNLDLPKAKLIVLSSCKSGLGKLVKGEGFLSLSRGFLYSGTPNIIFSLWNVKDEQTKDLMIQFYKKVLAGDSYAESLREAKLKLIKNPKTAEPKYWAAWTLVGE